MGLSDYKKYKREKELKESETISFLIKRIEKLEQEVKLLSLGNQSGFSKDDEAKIKAIQDKKTKPEDFIKMFTGDLEDFNPNA